MSWNSTKFLAKFISSLSSLQSAPSRRSSVCFVVSVVSAVFSSFMGSTEPVNEFTLISLLHEYSLILTPHWRHGETVP